MTARFGPRPVLIAGLSLLLAGLLLLARMPADASYVADLLPPLIVMGLGVGLTVPPIIMLAMAGAAPADTGMVSGFSNTAQQAGGALGLSVLAVVAAAHTSDRAASGVRPSGAARRLHPIVPGSRRLRRGRPADHGGPAAPPSAADCRRFHLGGSDFRARHARA